MPVPGSMLFMNVIHTRVAGNLRNNGATGSAARSAKRTLVRCAVLWNRSGRSSK